VERGGRESRDGGEELQNELKLKFRGDHKNARQASVHREGVFNAVQPSRNH